MRCVIGESVVSAQTKAAQVIFWPTAFLIGLEPKIGGAQTELCYSDNVDQ